MADVPSKATQYRFFERLQMDKASSQDVWEYALSTRWVEHVQQYIEDEENKTVLPIFSSEIEEENIYVRENNWKILARWYGFDNQYSGRRRCTIGSYVNVYASHGLGAPPQHGYVFADKLDFLTVRCFRLRDVDKEAKHRHLTFYFWDLADYVEFQLRCILKVHPSKLARMWLSLAGDGVYISLEEESFLKPSIGSIICKTYPNVFEALKKRQLLPSADHPASGVDALQSICNIKKDLASVFLSEQWQFTLCLEELPSLGADYIQCITFNKIPRPFRHLFINNLFFESSENQGWNDALKRIVYDVTEEFKKTAHMQLEKILSESEHLLQQAQLDYKIKVDELNSKMDEVAMKEKVLNREKELNERDHELNSKLDKYKSMLTEFLARKDAFDKDAVIMAEQNRITASKVDLNVGGIRYTTSLNTLLKEQGSLLHILFSGQYPLQPNADGSYFIDRDGTNFRHILYFLRDGPVSVECLKHDDTRLLSELRLEAKYFQLHRMIDSLNAIMSHGGKASMHDSRRK